MYVTYMAFALQRKPQCGARVSWIDMIETVPRLEDDHVKNIATLSKQLEVPVHEVDVIYRKEFDQLAVAARIRTFLGVLAMNRTRSILCGHGKRAMVH
jgi:hypothetical protein